MKKIYPLRLLCRGILYLRDYVATTPKDLIHFVVQMCALGLLLSLIGGMTWEALAWSETVPVLRDCNRSVVFGGLLLLSWFSGLSLVATLDSWIESWWSWLKAPQP